MSKSIDLKALIISALILALGIGLVITWLVTWSPMLIWLANLPLGFGGGALYEVLTNRY